MKSFLKMISVSVILILVLAACGNNEVKDAATYTKQDEHNFIETFGVVKSAEVKNIVIDFPASVKKVHVKEGELVDMGQPLITLDYEGFLVQIQNKEKELEMAKMELSQKIDSVGVQMSEVNALRKLIDSKKAGLGNETDADIKRLKNELDQAEEDYKKISDELELKKGLFNAGTISQKEYDECSMELERRRRIRDNAKASFESAKDNKRMEIEKLEREIDQKLIQLDNINSKSKISEIGNIKMQNENIKILEMELDLLKKKLDKSYIKGNDIVSDMDKSVVFGIGPTNGDIIYQQNKVLSLMGIKGQIVEADVPEEFVKDLKIGASVFMTPVADYSKKYDGKVQRISSKATKRNNDTVVTIDITIENGDDFLLPGFNMDVFIFK